MDFFDSSLIVLSLLDEGCFPIIIFSFEKKVHDHVDVCMAKNVSLWPSGLELYIIEKKKHQSSPKQGGIMVCTKLPLGSVKVQKN